MAVAAVDIQPGQQLLVDYTVGGKNKYLLNQNQVNRLTKDGVPLQFSKCLDVDGKPCKCERFFIMSTGRQSTSGNEVSLYFLSTNPFLILWPHTQVSDEVGLNPHDQLSSGDMDVSPVFWQPTDLQFPRDYEEVLLTICFENLS